LCPQWLKGLPAGNKAAYCFLLFLQLQNIYKQEAEIIYCQKKFSLFGEQMAAASGKM